MLAVAALVAAAFAASAAAAPSTTAKTPPCTRQALAAGLKRGPAKQLKAKFSTPFACAGSWAYSGVLLGSGADQVEATAVYQAVNGRWQSVNRTKPCARHLIPKKIYKGACLTN